MSITGKIKLMTTFIFALLLALIMLYAVNLEKVYHDVASREVKRQARQGNDLAKKIYLPLSYGLSLRIFLWLIILASAAGSVILFASLTSTWLAFILIVATLGMAFWWIPASRVGSFGAWLAKWSARPLGLVLHYLYPVLKPVAKLASDVYPVHVHTGLYEKADLLELLAWQSRQADNRIQPEELMAAEHALKFNDKLIGDITTPRQKVDTVSSTDTVGPLLMDELHKSGHVSFPVTEGKKNVVVGVLYLQDLLKVQSGGNVTKYMRGDPQYLHEDFSLYRALQVIQRSQQRLFMVINDQAEFVGIVTTEDILGQVVGRLAPDEFEAYGNPQAVISSLADKKTPVLEEKTDSEPTEVV